MWCRLRRSAAWNPAVLSTPHSHNNIPDGTMPDGLARWNSCFISYFPYTQSLFSSPVLDLLYLMSSVAKKATGLLHARRPRILQHNNNSGAWAARVQHIGSTEVQEVQNKRAVSHAAGERHDGFQAPVFCIQSEAMQ